MSFVFAPVIKCHHSPQGPAAIAPATLTEHPEASFSADPFFKEPQHLLGHLLAQHHWQGFVEGLPRIQWNEPCKIPTLHLRKTHPFRHHA